MIRFNESQSYFLGKDIISNISDILTGLSDEGIPFIIYPDLSDDIKIKMLGLYLSGSVTQCPIFRIDIPMRGIDWNNRIKNSILDVASELVSNLESIGIESEFTFRYGMIYNPKTFDSSIKTITDRDLKPEYLTSGLSSIKIDFKKV
jgi:hypothetical protein